MEASQIKDYPILSAYLEQNTDPLVSHIIDTIFLCGQDEIFFKHLSILPDPHEKLDELIETLKPVEQFYDVLGGLKAYHNEFLWLLDEKKTKQPDSKFLLPKLIDITSTNPTVNQAIRTTIENLEIMAEIFPVGGSGDRFALKDPLTKEDLPIAALQFCGHTLLERLIRDLQAKEYLCFKLRGVQIFTPVAMMTSNEKNNHVRITEILERNNWFGRGKDNFKLFIQPLVPVISEEGTWVQTAPLTLCMKPGGHGVLWKIAHDMGIFKWFESLKTSKALVRQINNPIAGNDYGLLSFIGLGIGKKKLFGFASCQRLVNSPEGMNALIEKYFPSAGCYEYALSNIEYTNFTQEGLQDIPSEPGGQHSAFPCNTNILFVDLPTVEQLCLKFPLPGMLINLKTTYNVLQPDGTFKELRGGRIETTMQNIADYLTLSTQEPLEDQEQLPQYITFNERVKTISVTKQQYKPGSDLEGTPEGALRDFITVYRELLTDYCKFELPPKQTVDEYLSEGPSFYFDYHPALGPLYSIIGQKLRKGKFLHGAELILEIAEFSSENLTLDGSLLIRAKTPCGHNYNKHKHEYSNMGGKCRLKNVTVSNKGIDRENTKHYWMGTPLRHECCLIEIEGCGEFHAEDVVLKGTKNYFVPDGHRLVVKASGEHLQAISEPTWHWDYRFADDNTIVLFYSQQLL